MQWLIKKNQQSCRNAGISLGDNEFLCPLCGIITSIGIATVEHIEPRSASPINHVCVSCVSCNSKSGHSFDFALKEKISERDFVNLDHARDIRVSIGDVTVNATMRRTESGKVEIEVDGKRNRPGVNQEMSAAFAKPGIKISMKFRSKATKIRLGKALLKCAYLKAVDYLGAQYAAMPIGNRIRSCLWNDSDPYEFLIGMNGLGSNASPFHLAYEGCDMLLVPSVVLPTATHPCGIFPLNGRCLEQFNTTIRKLRDLYAGATVSLSKQQE